MTIAEHIDALDRLVANHATTAEVREQIDLVGRLVRNLEIEYQALHEIHTQSNIEHAKTMECEVKKTAEADAKLVEMQKQNLATPNWGGKPPIDGGRGRMG